jgi:hypothetical protein
MARRARQRSRRHTSATTAPAAGTPVVAHLRVASCVRVLSFTVLRSGAIKKQAQHANGVLKGHHEQRHLAWREVRLREVDDRCTAARCSLQLVCARRRREPYKWRAHVQHSG